MIAPNYNRVALPADAPADDPLDSYIEQVEGDDERMEACREAAFEDEDTVALARLLANSKTLIDGLANGRKVFDLDVAARGRFAALAREVDRLAANLSDKVADEAREWMERDQADAAEARDEARERANEEW